MTQIANLGKSFKYPLQPNENGNVAKVSGTESIDQSIYSILSTPIGTAFYQEDRGSMLHTLVYEPNDQILRSLLDLHIVEALNKWEKRIRVIDVFYSNENEDRVNCQIIYVVKATGLKDSYIYPFNREIDR